MKTLYQTMFEQIGPSPTLLAETKAKMLQAAERLHSRRTIRTFVLSFACLGLLCYALWFGLGQGLWNRSQNLPEPPTVAETDPVPQQGEETDAEENQNQLLVDWAPREMINATRTRLTEAEAYAVPLLGALLPQKLLPGYHFEDASLYEGEEGEMLLFSYTDNYDYLTIWVSRMREEDAPRLVSVDVPETYAIVDYSIPLADTVPEALYKTIDNPIFLAEELTAEALSLRNFEMHEADGSQGRYWSRFGVLCGDYLVAYSIRGDHMEDVYDMVCSAAFFKE